MFDWDTYWKKYKWFIIGYVIYVCFMSTVVADSYGWGKFGHSYIKEWIIWCVMTPLIVYSISSYITYRKKKNKREA